MSSSVAQTELACVYSSLILADDNMEITPDAIRNILKAAGYEFESFWPKFFCEGIKGIDIQSLLSSVTCAPAVASTPIASATAEPAANGSKESKKKEPEPEEEDDDDDIGIGSMFD